MAAPKSEEQYALLRKTVRDVIALDPSVSPRALARALTEKTNMPIGKDFAAKLMGKARKQAIKETELAEVTPYVSAIVERSRMLIERMQKIVFADDGKVTEGERAKATNTIIHIERVLFTIMQDAGIFKKQVTEVHHTHELSPEIKAIMKGAPQWSFTGARVIEPELLEAAPLMLDAAVIESDNGEPQPDNSLPAEPKIFEPGAVDIAKQKRLAAIAAGNKSP